MALGWVYVLSNEAMPDLVKIGQSAADPDLRALELHTTGVPTPFIVEYKGLFENYAQLERLTHNAFLNRRYSAQREFFRVSPEAVVRKLQQLSGRGPKFEVCNFKQRPPKSDADSHAWTPIIAREFPWVRAERERRRSHRLSEHLEPSNQRIINCRNCGEFLRSSQPSCHRCGKQTSIS